MTIHDTCLSITDQIIHHWRRRFMHDTKTGKPLFYIPEVRERIEDTIIFKPKGHPRTIMVRIGFFKWTQFPGKFYGSTQPKDKDIFDTISISIDDTIGKDVWKRFAKRIIAATQRDWDVESIFMEMVKKTDLYDTLLHEVRHAVDFKYMKTEMQLTNWFRPLDVAEEYYGDPYEIRAFTTQFVYAIQDMHNRKTLKTKMKLFLKAHLAFKNVKKNYNRIVYREWKRAVKYAYKEFSK